MSIQTNINVDKVYRPESFGAHIYGFNLYTTEIHRSIYEYSQNKPMFTQSTVSVITAFDAYRFSIMSHDFGNDGTLDFFAKNLSQKIEK